MGCSYKLHPERGESHLESHIKLILQILMQKAAFNHYTKRNNLHFMQ
jgi:hypothetical protein